MAAPSAETTPTPEPTDGRRARGERSRDAVVEAILGLIREGNESPGAAEIAERAGVSMRSVFRHFDDLETLRRAAIERHSEMMLPLYELADPGGPVADRVAALVDQRAALYEEITPVRLVGERIRRQSESISAGLDLGRRSLRHQLGELFAAELDQYDPTTRRDVLDALEAATSWAAWRVLRYDQDLPLRRARAAMARMATAILGAP